jgi:hypothetical protein
MASIRVLVLGCLSTLISLDISMKGFMGSAGVVKGAFSNDYWDPRRGKFSIVFNLPIWHKLDDAVEGGVYLRYQ